MRSKKKRPEIKYSEVELMIVPFIDVFSMLNTFLLMTAVFTSIGIIEVQIPFLTTAPPPPKEHERVIDIKVDMEKDGVEVTSEWSQPPVDQKKQKFPVTKAGAEDMHKFLVEIKRTSPDADKVSFFTEDDVIWKDMSMILDAVKLRQPTDPVFPLKPDATKGDAAMAQEFLFPKVTMSSVML